MLAKESIESTTTKNVTAMELRDEREIVIKRAFNGPARIVFEAWTRPDLVKRWWAPKCQKVTLYLCEADVRVGGQYRYVLRHEDSGQDITFYGEYREITPHSRLVYTQGLVPFPDPVLVTVTFEERYGKTHLVSREVYPSKESRDAAIASGMEHGMREAMEQLEELLAQLR